MNRGPTLLHYDLKVVTYSNSTKSQHHFTVRVYLKNGKRWTKFPFLATQSRMVVVGRILARAQPSPLCGLQHVSYQPNMFIYAWGPFYFVKTEHYSHPGFEVGTKLDPYQNHCPEAAPPSIVLIGTVVGRPHGRLNEGPTLLSYPMEVTVYSASTRSQITFPIRAFLKNGKRWAKFPTLTPRTSMVVIGRLCGFTKPDPILAIMVEDFNFIGTTKTEPDTPQTPDKQPAPDRWSRQVGPPPKKSKQGDYEPCEPSSSNLVLDTGILWLV